MMPDQYPARLKAYLIVGTLGVVTIVFAKLISGIFWRSFYRKISYDFNRIQ